MKKKNLPQISIILFLTLLLSLPLTLTQTQAATLKAPKQAVRQINNYLQVSWNKVSGAQGYVIYTKNSQSASWKKFKTVSASTVKYNYKTVSSGKRYYFTVRAYRKTGGKIIYSAYSKTGASCYYLTKPSLRISEKTHKSVTLSWNKVPGATGYKVIRSDSVIVDTKELKYTDSVEPNTKYTYTVRAYKGTSYVDSSVVNVTTPKIPVNEAIETKVYEGFERQLILELKNNTNNIYYNIKASIKYYDVSGNIVWAVPYPMYADYIPANSIWYAKSLGQKIPSVPYNYYKVELECMSDTLPSDAFDSVKISNSKFSDDKIISYDISNPTDRIVSVGIDIIFLKNGVPIYQTDYGMVLNVHRNVNKSEKYDIPINFDDVKIQLTEARFW